MALGNPSLIPCMCQWSQYYRRLRDYYHDLCRPPIAVQHEVPSLATSSSPQRITEHVKGLHAEHVEANGLEGFQQSWQPKRPTKYLRELAVKERAKALTEDGLYSQRVKRLNAMGAAKRELLENLKKSGS